VQTQLSIPGSPPAPKSELSQWFTSPELAARIVEWADPTPYSKVLEPSAGSGSFVRPLLERFTHVHAVELDPDWANILRELPGTVQVHQADFMAWHTDEHFDLAVTNPPYEDGQDCEHVFRALQCSDRVVALVRANFLHGVDRYNKIWKHHWLKRLVHLSSRPHFSGAGSPRHDFSVVEICKRFGSKEKLTHVEWWK